MLFVHGSWHNPNHFRRVRDLFESNGFPTSCSTLPSTGSLLLIGLHEDVQEIRDELKGLITTKQKEVIVVAHSYGGIVTAEAVDEAFALSARTDRGLSGGVVRLVYMCAFLLPLGESVVSGTGGAFPPFISIDEVSRCALIKPTGEESR